VLDPASGLFDDARRVRSPNRDLRPPGVAIDAVILHAISLPPDSFGGDDIERLFTNCLNPDVHPFYREIAELRVSSHLLIRRDGELVQFVPCHERAWHAGASCLFGRSRCNDFSVGVELEGCDSRPFEEAQYRRLEAVLGELMTVYPGIAPERIVGHCHIAPGRKTDPGPCFDWERLQRNLGVPQPHAHHP
jgi:AmpD protein